MPERVVDFLEAVEIDEQQRERIVTALAQANRLVESVQQQAARSVQKDLGSLTDRVDGLENRIRSIAGDQRTSADELSVVQDDIDELRKRISDLERSGGAGGGALGGVAAGAGATPGAAGTGGGR